jgi:hypothetical protein
MYENEISINVYIKTDYNNNIIDIGSDIFIKDTFGWIWIDSGLGDKYAHAQSQYLSKPLTKENGEYNYKYNSGKIVEV